MILNFEDREQFARILHENISPTSPIQSQEHLYGREKQVQQIEQALYSPGRSVFIYGDRGVGKTSLAQTVAYAHQSVNEDPILVACTPTSTFAQVLGDVIAALRKTEKPRTVSTTKARFVIPKLPIGIELEHSRKPPENVTGSDQFNLNNTVEILRQIGDARPAESLVVVLDEFDRLASDVERTHFADFIKQIGDKRIAVRFVFCGVSDSMQKLLGAHGSCYRYLEGVELQQLSWEARFEIIETAANALRVVIDERPRLRIAAISDGFPHYIHLICEKLFWQMFNDPAPCTSPNIHHFREAVSQAVLGIEQHLRTTYDRAAMKDTPDYEEVLWAVADHPDLFRSTESIYESYWQLFGGLDQPEGTTILERSTVVSRLNALKNASCGSILTNVPSRKGWYQFRESIMRGYVRLRAEEKGLELALDYSGVSSASASQAWPVRGARRSRKGMTPKDWEQIRNPRGFEN